MPGIEAGRYRSGMVRPRSLVFDGAVAVGALAVSLALAPGAARSQPGTTALDFLAYPIMVLACVVLAARRERPLLVAGVVGAALLIYAVRDYPGGPLVVPVLVALYSVGAGVGRRPALVTGALAVLLVTARSVTAIAVGGEVSAFSWAAPGWVLAGLFGGMVVRSRRLAVQAIRDRAEQAERTREETARARVAEERLRIARDLHDVVGNSFVAVHVQARVAAELLEDDLAGAREALAAIQETSRRSLREIRATLGVLRGDTPIAPVAAARLRELLAPARAAGLTVNATIDDPLGLADPVAHVVYRVVQESLTNVLRHAHASVVTVSVTTDGPEVSVDVRDNGAGPSGLARAPDGEEAPDVEGARAGVPGVGDGVGGHGLTGMRERVEALGGRLEAGPADGGGWRVLARLPIG